MKKVLNAFICLLIWSGGTVLAGEGAARAKDEAAIRAIVAGLAEAWTAGDAEGWAKPFAEDADFTVWTGAYVKGREGIARGHEQIFNTIYKGTKQRLAVRSIRFLGDDVAVVHVEGSVVRKEEDFPESPQVVPVFVLARDAGHWQIVAFHNTRVQSR